MNPSEPTVWVAGASGLVGRALLDELLQQPGLRVQALLRRPIGNLPDDPRLTQTRVDFARADLGLPVVTTTDAPPAQALYIALGTTIKQAGSQAAFRAVDLDAVLHTARAARAAGIQRCAVVSAMGADAHSGVFYTRIKGEAEAALIALGFERLVLARPSLLLGDREALGQPQRAGELWTERLTRPLRGLIPLRWRPIDAAVVARAMRLALHQSGPAVEIVESKQLQQLGARR